MAMRWASILAPAAVVLTASGCLGGAATPTTAPVAVSPTVRLQPRPFAVFHIRGRYVTSRRNHFTGNIDRLRFTLSCRSPQYYAGHYGRASWRSRLCIALLDYPTRLSQEGIACSCPVSTSRVDVRGTVRGRPVRMVITPCTCDGRQAAADARIILRTRPRAQAM
jgi:hypothetical protein